MCEHLRGCAVNRMHSKNLLDSKVQGDFDTASSWRGASAAGEWLEALIEAAFDPGERGSET